MYLFQLANHLVILHVFITIGQTVLAHNAGLVNIALLAPVQKVHLLQQLGLMMFEFTQHDDESSVDKALRKVFFFLFLRIWRFARADWLSIEWR